MKFGMVVEANVVEAAVARSKEYDGNWFADEVAVVNCASTPYTHEKGQCPCSSCGSDAYSSNVLGEGTNKKDAAVQRPSDTMFPVLHDTELLARARLPHRELLAAIAALVVPSVKGGGVVMSDQSI